MVAISPDGSRVAFSDEASGQYNLVVAPTDGGPETRLTAYQDSTVRNFLWTRDSSSLIFSADSNGDEFWQIRRVPADGGEIESLTDQPTVQFALGELSADGRRLSYAGNDRDPAAQDVLVRDLSSGEIHRVFAEGGYVFSGRWTPDGKHLLAIRAKSNTEQSVFLVGSEGAGGAELLLPVDDAPAVYLPGSWLPDGSGFLVRTDLGRDFVGLAVFELEERRLRWLATPEWDVEHAALSADGRILVWSVNVNGTSRVHAMELATRAELDVPELPQGTIVALSVDGSGRRVALIMATGPVPANVVVVNLVDGSTRWITDATAVVAFDAVEPDLVSYDTFDERTVPAWLYRPSGDGPFPIVVSIHGGPQAQERPAYNYGGLYQYLVANGIGVLAPNVRGSAGYGRTYQCLIMRDWGGGDLRDLEAAAIYLRDLDWVARDRIGVFGASYGGFATLSCLGRLPQFWACGVDIVGPANLVTLVRSTVPTWRSSTDELIGNPDTDAEILMSRSPISYVDQIRAPLFVIQGANDPRVPQAESDQLVAALRGRGVDVRYDVYDDEGHGFTRRANEEKAIGDSADFLVRHLRG